jgi:hypothetical protein
MFEQLHLEPTYKLGDLITSTSVLIALAGFLYSWSKDRRLRTKEHADRVRSAAATTLAKLDRCERLFLSYFEFLQPVVTEADELIVKTQNVIECRDSFWKQAINTRLAILRQYDAEEIELAYAPLLPFRRDIYGIFRAAIGNAREAEYRLFWRTQNRSQAEILGMPEGRKICSAELGNKLRELLDEEQAAYKEELENKFTQVRKFLRDIIASTDKSLATPIAGEDHVAIGARIDATQSSRPSGAP